MTRSKLIPVTQWNKFHSWPPMGGLRHLIYNREKNGFDKVLVRPTRAWLIDEDKFFEWIKNKNYKHPLEKKDRDLDKQDD